jgi:hypothetical protein
MLIIHYVRKFNIFFLINTLNSIKYTKISGTLMPQNMPECMPKYVPDSGQKACQTTFMPDGMYPGTLAGVLPAFLLAHVSMPFYCKINDEINKNMV